MDLVRIRKMREMGSLDAITNLEDNVRKNYSVDWHLPYVELRTELINAYQLMERRRLEAGAIQKKGHPVMPILQGHEQPGSDQRACYGCGQKGDHMMVTLAGYCIHSTVVPAIVPKYFLAPTEEIHGKELLFSNGGGCYK
jgi:hypothetical protein